MLNTKGVLLLFTKKVQSHPHHGLPCTQATDHVTRKTQAVVETYSTASTNSC
jgi:hypothetical protein